MSINRVSLRGAIAAVFTVALVGLLLSACGGSSSSSSSSSGSTTAEAEGEGSASPAASNEGTVSGTIRMLGNSAQEAAMSAVIEEFESANPEVHVDVQYASPTNYYQVLTTQVQGGNAPDVFYTNGGIGQTTSIVPLAEAGKLADLSTSPWAGEIPKPAHDLYFVGGKAYGLPLWEKPLGVVYNVAEFEKIGIEIPTTWEQFLGQCSQIKAAGKIPMAGIGANFMNAIIPSGSTVYSKEPEWNAERTAGKVAFASTTGWNEALETVEELQEAECYEPGVAGASVEAAIQLMASSEALMLLAPSDAIGAITAGGAEDIGSFPFPGKTESETLPINAYSDALAVSASSGVLEADEAFLDFLAEPAHAKHLAELAGTISIQAAAKGELPPSLKAYAPYYEEEEITSYPPDLWEGSGSLEALSTGSQEILTGQSDAKGVLEKADAAWGK